MFYEQFRALCKVRNETPSHVLECIGLTRMNASLWKKGGMPSAQDRQTKNSAAIAAEFFKIFQI